MSWHTNDGKMLKLERLKNLNFQVILEFSKMFLKIYIKRLERPQRHDFLFNLLSGVIHLIQIPIHTNFNSNSSNSNSHSCKKFRLIHIGIHCSKISKYFIANIFHINEDNSAKNKKNFEIFAKSEESN
jgi:hypothetical protein